MNLEEKFLNSAAAALPTGDLDEGSPNFRGPVPPAAQLEAPMGEIPLIPEKPLPANLISSGRAVEATVIGQQSPVNKPAADATTGVMPVTGRVFPEDTASIQSIPRNDLQEFMGNIGSAIQSGAEYLDFAVIGLPDVGTLTLKDLTVGDLGKVMEAMSYGFAPTTGEGQTLRPTPEALDLLNAIPAFQAASKAVKYGAKGLRAGAEALAPAAADVIESGLRKTGMITDIVPDGKSVPQQIPPAQIKETGGLSFPSVDTDNRLRLKAKREESILAGKAPAGAPKNTRVEIQAPEGSSLPNFVVGNITPQDWISRTESMLSKEEIAKYAKWYDDIKGTFLKYTNNDEEKADKYMRAWLVANQNIGVDGALSNMLLQAEQFARKVPKQEMKAGGLPMATQAARNALLNEPITEGVGAKISDFVDSAEGKSVRSFYGNNQAGGSPFVVDIHTARDTGLVDEILLNHLERKGYQVDRQNIKTDFAAGPTETQYENRADFGRALTKYLNDNSWQGRTDWTPKEVQAVGWMAMTKLTADASEDSVTALERNLRRISMEVAPAVGSPWEKKFGEKFSSLPAQRQSEITQVVTDRAMQAAKEISGIDFREMVHGTGGWQTFQNPAAVAQTLATREGAEIAANVLGYLLQQTEVWVNSIKGTTKNPKALAIDFIESGSDNLSTNEGIRSFWEKIMAADPTGLFVGYQPIKTIDGEVGIRVIVDKANATKMQNVQNALSKGGQIDNVLSSLDFDVKSKGYESDLVKAGNNWKESPDGKAYLGRLADLGVKRTAADLDPIRSEFEKIIESELAGTGGKPASAGTKSATTKAKQVIKRSQSAPLKGAE